SLPAKTDPPEMALRLTAILGGLGSQVTRGLLTYARARKTLAGALDRELDTPGGPRQAATLPATGYLRVLATLVKQAVQELSPLAPSSAERNAIETVSELIDRVTGGAALVAQGSLQDP